MVGTRIIYSDWVAVPPASAGPRPSRRARSPNSRDGRTNARGPHDRRAGDRPGPRWPCSAADRPPRPRPAAARPTPLTRAKIAAPTGISKLTVSEAAAAWSRTASWRRPGAETSGRRGPADCITGRGPAAAWPWRSSVGPTDPRRAVRPPGEARWAAWSATPDPGAGPPSSPRRSPTPSEATPDRPGPVRAAPPRSPVRSTRPPGGSCTCRFALPPRRARARPLLEPLVDVRPPVDNDVNWAALAEHDAGAAPGLDEFSFLHLGHGLGAALVQGGRLAGGHGGLAGEP